MKKRLTTLLALLLVAVLAISLVACTKTYELSDTNLTLNEGEEKQLTISPEPKDVTWDSDNKSVATVADGLVKAVGAGTAKITATIDGVDEPLTCTVKVNASSDVDEVDGYSFETKEITIKTGEEYPLSIIDENGNHPSSVTYTSDDNTIATVTAAGVVTGVKAGETKIKAQLANGTLTCKVNVEQGYTYTLDKTSFDLAKGASYTLKLQSDPADGINKEHTFTSDNPNVATVDGGSGKVTGVGAGTATITCSVDGQEIEATVHVYEYTVKIGEDIIDKDTEITVEIDQEYSITVTVDPEIEFTVAYDSSDEDTIAIDADGNLTLKKEGTATITVTVGGRDFTATVTVHKTYLPSATTSFDKENDVKALENKTYDISALGNEDWVYANNDRNDHSMVRKAGVSGIIKEGDITHTGNWGSNDGFEHAKFTWNALDGTAAPAEALTGKFLWVNEWYAIPVHLTAGEHVVTLYLSGWNAGYTVAVTDTHDNVILAATEVVSFDGAKNQAVEVAIALNVTTDDDFTFTVTRTAESDGGGNHGWAAIAVSNQASFTLEDTEYELELDGTTTPINVIGGENLIYTSGDTSIVEVNSQGVMTPVGMGATYINISDGKASLRIYVNVIKEITVTSRLEEIDWDIENLATASSEYETIDYKHWHDQGTTSMDGGAGLIGEPNGASGNFWDYKGSIGYTFNETSNRNVGMSYGKVANNGFTLSITIDKNVSGLVFYTGAYKANAVVTFKIGTKEVAKEEFTADEGIARKIIVTIDTDGLTSNFVLTIEGTAESLGGGSNVNVNAVAVIGKVEHTLSATGSSTKTSLGPRGDNHEYSGNNKVDLTAEGTYSWFYSQFDGNAGYHKVGSNAFGDFKYYDKDGNQKSGDLKWNGVTAFKWSDGVLNGSDEQEGSNNPADVNNEDWDGHNEYTNNYISTNGEIHLGMHLEQGKYTIKVYMDGWAAHLAAGIYDGNKNFIVGKVCINDNPGGGSAWMITFTLDVTTEDDFTLVIGKVRSHGDGEVGWQAVAIATIDDQND